ncbi:UDP-glucosyltransferase [Pseudonocardiaceae bacterium YIM PH 21723]|nr:UDP-glucosyltransferase [Pseudonocardiaceae bacterium YIM PH 21723]
MSHFAFACMPAQGHLMPLLAVTRELVGRGHRVTIPTTKEFQQQVEASGAAAPLYEQPSNREFGDDPDLMREAKPDSFPLAAVFRMFLDEAAGVAPQVKSILDGDRPDLFVYDQMTWAGWLLADKWRVPHVMLFPSLVTGQQRPSFAAGIEQMSDPETRASLDDAVAATRAALDLPPAALSEFGAHEPELGIAFLPKAFQPDAEQIDERYEFVGPCLGERTGTTGWQPPAGDLPLVYLSLGSAFNQQPTFYRTVIEALRDEPVRVEMAIGEQVKPEELGEIPANFRLHGFAPQLEILPHASVFITHCGMGGTQEGLSFGVPLIGVPQMFEQQMNAERVVQLGLGKHIPPAEVTADRLRTAVRELLADPEIGGRLTAMRAAIQTAGGSARAADVLEHALTQYANR